MCVRVCVAFRRLLYYNIYRYINFTFLTFRNIIIYIRVYTHVIYNIIIMATVRQKT